VKLAPFALCAALCAAPLALAQKLDLKFDTLAAHATDKVELDLDSTMLRLFLRFGGDSNLPGGVRAVRVRHYAFDKTGGYSQKDLEPLRSQITGQPRWSRIVNTKEGDSTTEIFAVADGDKLGVCLVVVAEPTELTVVYLEGTISLADLKGIGGNRFWRGFR
jgi:hypothetical protein